MEHAWISHNGHMRCFRCLRPYDSTEDYSPCVAVATKETQRIPESHTPSWETGIEGTFVGNKEPKKYKCDCGNPKDHVPDGIACWKWI